MKPKVLSLGAGYKVLRLKILQGAGDDAITRRVAGPEASQMQPSTNRRINQDICALKQSYLTNQKDFRHETNFHEF